MSQPNEKESQPIVTYGTPTLNEWKMYLRNLQRIPIQQSGATPDSSSSESSFELDVSFRALLDRKRQEMQEKACEIHFLAETTAGDGASRTAPSMSANDSTFIEQDSISKLSDTSFEEMERICAVVDKVNGYDTIGGGGNEKEELVKPSPTALSTLPGTLVGDVTQLEDIDEPSGLWENTILPGAATLSPVKRMHLLRPSTILEETTTSSAEASKNSSIDTFISAKPVVEEESDIRSSAISGSDVYQTAQDTFGTNSYACSSLDVDSVATEDTHAQAEGYSKNSTREAGEEEESALEEQIIINLDSSSSDIEEEKTHERSEKEWYRETTDPLASITATEHVDESLLEQDESRDEATENYTYEESVLDEIPDHFNDTLEETDFKLRQGMKLMALKKQQQEEEERRKEEVTQHSSYLYAEHTPNDKSTKKGQMSYLTPTGGSYPSKMTVSHGLTGSGGKQALFPSVGKKHAPNSAGAATSGGSFKKPVSRVPQLRTPVRKFDHIVSPISAYIKNTPTSVLTSKIPHHYLNFHSSENRDSAASTASSSSSTKENQHFSGSGIKPKGYTSTLPTKGFINSRRAHVLDERNVMRIPGGEKMQKLIEKPPALVIRHEGRIRYAERSAGGEAGIVERNNISALTDDSLAELSLMSSDVSVRVLKDAQRYN